MSYFTDHYNDIGYPADGDKRLYEAQLGAIHAIASHFTLNDLPAIVTMPTGSGKTAVLAMTPFILRRTRALVITPSRLVRGQIVEDLRDLKTLREIGVFPAAGEAPRVVEVAERIDSVEEWERLRDFDIVVSTPNCVSPSYPEVPPQPPDLFDLLLIDEAHHTPARTWAGILEAFPSIPRVLFTATPFRRDRGEIVGRFAYSYPVARAYKQGIFGQIRYVEVQPTGGDSQDTAVAKRTEEQFRSDRDAGFHHFIMVRTDRRKRAKELEDVYRASTQLRLRIVDSHLSSGTAKRILRQLEHDELDGIICVNMLGEGFNFPNLKIAAIHAPHRSLEITLQFIGRFARTNAPDIGEAKFLAVPSDIEIEGRRLFSEGVIWQEIVPDLSHGRIAQELRIRDALQRFDDADALTADLADLSLYAINPRSHVKIYDVRDGVDLQNARIEFPADMEICYRNVNRNDNILILITRQRGAPKWSSGEKILNLTHDLFVVLHDPQSQLLFVNSSRSIDTLYEIIAGTVAPTASPLATGQVGRVVKGISNQRVFNVGMRNIQATNPAESYRIITGSDTQATITPADSRRYRQGHVYLAGDEDGERTTIGYSSGSKVWGSAALQIPDLLDWCKRLGTKIRSSDPIVTHSGLDYLATGKVVDSVPSNIVHVQWNRDAFNFDPPTRIRYTADDGRPIEGHILDLELELDRARTDANTVGVRVTGDGVAVELSFTFADFYAVIEPADRGRITVVQGASEAALEAYLNESYLDFYTAEGGLLSGNELFEPHERATPIDLSQVEVWDWSGVDVESEIVDTQSGQSVQNRVRSQLEQSGADTILFDHGTGEIADYVTVTEQGDATVFRLYHCKGSTTATPGARVGDVYEVCGQAQKSVALMNLSRLEKRLRQRQQGGSQFVRGDATLLADILARARERRHRFEVVVVQPGISKRRISDGMKESLGATNSHLLSAGGLPLRVIASP